MEENKFTGIDQTADSEGGGSLDFKTIYTMAVLNWKWFVL